MYIKPNVDALVQRISLATIIQQHQKKAPQRKPIEPRME